MKQDRQKQAGSHTGMSKGHEADELNKLLSLWLHSSIRVMDVRHIRLEPEALLQPYRLPAQAFVFVLQGSVRLMVIGRIRHIQGTYCMAAKALN